MKIELQDSGEPNSGKRRLRRIPGDTKQVVLWDDSGQSEQGEVIDESFGGIGLRFDTEFRFEAGQEFEVSYNGVQLWAVVRHVATIDAGSSRVGLEWKAVGLSRMARETMTDGCDGQELAVFKETLPSGLYMMWRLFECEKWFELGEKAGNLRSLARKCEFSETLTGYVRGLQDAVELEDPKDPSRKALHALIEECIRVTTGRDEQIANTLETNLA